MSTIFRECTNCNGSGKNYHAPESSSATLPPCDVCKGMGVEKITMRVKTPQNKRVKSPKMKPNKKARLIKILFSANKPTQI